MITCPQCGAENPLGKVFCISCGTKLPAQGLNLQDFEKMSKIGRVRNWVIRIVGTVLTVWILTVIIMALVPQSEPFYDVNKKLSVGQGRQCSRKLSACMRAMRAGDECTVELSESEINAYIAFAVLEKTNARRGSVQLDNGAMRVRWNMSGPFGMPMSFDTLLGRMSDGRLVPYKMWMGHLPLSMGAKSLAKDVLRKMCESRKEWPVLRHFVVDEISAGKIKVSAPPHFGATSSDANAMPKELPLYVEESQDNAAAGKTEDATDDDAEAAD